MSEAMAPILAIAYSVASRTFGTFTPKWPIWRKLVIGAGRARAKHHLRVVLETKPYRRLANAKHRPDSQRKNVLLLLRQPHGLQPEPLIVSIGSLHVLGGLELPSAAHEPGFLALVEDDIVVFGAAAQKLLAGRAGARILQHERPGCELRGPCNVGDVERHIAELPIAKWDWHSYFLRTRYEVSGEP